MATEIQFIYAKNVISRTVGGTFQEISFALRVRNLGFGKWVGVHWCGEDGAWRVAPAEYRCPLSGGDEAWVAEVAMPASG